MYDPVITRTILSAEGRIVNRDTVLPIFTNYRPKSHDLETLSHMVAGCDPAFLPVFPKTAEEEKERFDLLRRAYVEARYNPGYKITREQLEYLAARVKKLQELTKTVCETRIESYLSARTGRTAKLL